MQTAVIEHVRHLSKEELPLCIPHGLAFHKEFKLPGKFVPDVFLRNWNAFYDQHQGTVISYWNDRELIGGLGGFIFRDLFDDRVVATEIFWFVDAAHRNRSAGFRLLKAYESWAFGQGAVETRVLYLVGGEHDEQLGRLYQKLGYKQIEIGWAKPLVDLGAFTWPS